MATFADQLGLPRFVMNSRCTKFTEIASFQPQYCIDLAILTDSDERATTKQKKLQYFEILKISSEISGFQDFQ